MLVIIIILVDNVFNIMNLTLNMLFVHANVILCSCQHFQCKTCYHMNHTMLPYESHHAII